MPPVVRETGQGPYYTLEANDHIVWRVDLNSFVWLNLEKALKPETGNDPATGDVIVNYPRKAATCRSRRLSTGIYSRQST